jgi:hypothetical protein
MGKEGRYPRAYFFNHSHAQCTTLMSPSGAHRISKGVTHPPCLTTSKGAHHYNFFKSTQHPTYLRTHQYLDISVPPGCAQCESAADHCKATTRVCTQVTYKYQHQSFGNTHTYNTNYMPDYAPCTISPTQKTPAIPTNSQPGNI